MLDKTRMVRAPPNTRPPPDFSGRRFFVPNQPINQSNNEYGGKLMEFFTSAIGTLKVLVIALGAGLGVWGVINLLEGYGNDNPGAKSQGMKQLMAGGGVALIGMQLIPLLANLFSTGG